MNLIFNFNYLISILAGSFIFLYLIISRFLADWKVSGRVFFSFVNLISVFYLGILLLGLFENKNNLLQFFLILFIFILTLISLSLMWLELFNILNVISRKKWRRVFNPIQEPVNYFPMVSFHLPISNEPPEIVRETLNSLSRLNYPNFEVIVIDNNTRLKKLWLPIREHCQTLGSYFKFFHQEVMPGAKAEALNYTLTKTNPQAQIIGVVDSDYIIHPQFLKTTTPYFQDSKVAIVQCPQDWRDFDQKSFLGSLYLVYRYFFVIFMPSFNEYNAASFMGTMGLIRKEALEEIGGWDENCVTEDMELGIRIHSRGYSTCYLQHSFGGGVMPGKFSSFRNQRIRWILGNMQVIKKHWKKIFLPHSPLNFSQRISYLAGLSIWFNNLFFPTLFFLGASTFYLWQPSFIISPLVIWPLIILFFTFFFRRAFGFLWALRKEEGAGWGKSFEAFIIFLSLSWVGAMIWFFPLIKSGREFFRLTEKSKSRDLFFKNWWSLREEMGLGLISLILALFILIFLQESLKWLLGIPLFFLAGIYLSVFWSNWRFLNT